MYDFTFSASSGIDSVLGDTKSARDCDDNYYTIDGRLVRNPTRGIYIKNGKKIAIY